MLGLDWLAAALALTVLVGVQMAPSGVDAERPRPLQGQLQSDRATLRLGPTQRWSFADSGALGAEERAIAFKQAIRRAALRYAFPEQFKNMYLAASGAGEVWELRYMDARLCHVTAADARLNGAESAEALARRWRDQLAYGLANVPSPLPDGWLAVEGEPSGRVALSDRVLAASAAMALDVPVRVAVHSGVIILDGVVGTEAQRQRVLRLARQLPGAAGVEDRLRVAP